MTREGGSFIGAGVRGSEWRVFVALAWLGATSPAMAQDSPRTARLTVESDAGTEECAAEARLRERVAERVGRDPFADDAELAVRVRVLRARRELRAQIEVRDSSGQVLGTRELRGVAGECGELMDASAFALSLLLDPFLSAPSPSPPPAEGPPPSDPVVTPPVAPVPEPPPRTEPVDPAPPPSEDRAHVRSAQEAPATATTELRLGAALVGALGLQPGPSFGLSASIGVTGGHASIALEGLAQLPSSDTASDGTGVSASVLLGALVPCWLSRPLGVCAVVAAGSMRGRGVGVDVPQRDSSVLVLAGLRALAEAPITRAFALRAQLDLLANVMQTTLRLDGEDRWTAPLLSATFGAGILVSLQ